MKRVAFIIALGLLASSATFAESFRCGTSIILEGDTRDKVATKCGEPTDVLAGRSVFRRPVVWYYGRPRYIGEDFIEVSVESWVYNLGPNKLMRRITFEDGVVVEIETLGYGYHPVAKPE